jgi:hypothetical protein
MGHEELPLMPEENVTRRRHVLLVDVTQAASEVSRLRWAVLLEEVIR